MRMKMIVFFLVLAMGCLLIYSAPWAQQKYTASPKQVQSSQPAQQAGPKVTFSKSSSAVSKPVATVSPQNLPRALTPEQRRQAIREARLAAGLKQANLPPDPPVTIRLTPSLPVQGEIHVSHVMTDCVSTNYTHWALNCGDIKGDPRNIWDFTIWFVTIPGKTYLLDIAAVCSGNDSFILAGDVDLTLRPDRGHLLSAFRTTSRRAVIRIRRSNPGGKQYLITQIELTRID